MDLKMPQKFGEQVVLLLDLFSHEEERNTVLINPKQYTWKSG